MPEELRTFRIPSAPEYEAQIGISPQNRPAVLEVFRKLMRQLRAVRKANAAIYYQGECAKDRKICETCAFAPKTRRRRGMLATAHAIMYAIRDPKQHFMCHHNQPGHSKDLIDRQRLIHCLGFLLVREEPEAQQAAERAAEAIRALGVKDKRVRPPATK